MTSISIARLHELQTRDESTGFEVVQVESDIFNQFITWMHAYADTCKCRKAFSRSAVECRKEQVVGWKKAVPVSLSVAVAARIPA